MGKKASMDTKWKVIGGIILAILGAIFAYYQWYAEEHHDMEDGHHGQEQTAPAEKDRPGAVKKR
jgi:hypothetical protein